MAEQTLRPTFGYFSLTGASGTVNGSTFVNSSSAYTTVDEASLNTTDKIVVGYAGSGPSTTVSFNFSDYTRISKISSSYGTIYSFLDDTLSSEYYEFGSSSNEYTPFVVINTDLSGIASVSNATLKLYPTFTQYGMLGRTLRIRIYDSPDAELPSAVGDISGYYINTLSMTTYSFLTNEVSSFISIDVTSLINSVITKYGYCTNLLFMIEMLSNGESTQEFVYIGSSNNLEITYQPPLNTIPNSSPASISVHLQVSSLSVIPQSGYIGINVNKYNSSTYNGGLRYLGLYAIQPNGTSISLGNVNIGSVASGVTSTATTHYIPITFDYDNASEAYNNNYLPYLRALITSSGNTSILNKGNISLYINQFYTTVFGNAPINGDATLYMKAPEPNNSGHPLFISGPIPTSGYTTLFLDAHPPQGDVPLYICGHETEETGVPLYICGHGSSYSGLDLCIQGGINKSFDLYIKSEPYPMSSGNTPLVIWPLGAGGSGVSSDSTTIYTLNFNNESGEAPLFISGPGSGTYNEVTPLYLYNLGDISKGQDLVIQATVNSGTNQTTLFTSSFFTDSGIAPIYISGPASGNVINGHTLYIKSVDPDSYDSITGRKLLPFVMYNNLLNSSGNVSLSIGNGFQSSGNYPLYIAGGGIVDQTDTVTLFMDSRVNSSGDVPLSILAGMVLNNHDLFMQAKELTGDSGNPTLFIYSALGSGAYNSTELTIACDDYGSRIPIFLAAAAYGESNAAIPMHIGQDQNSISSTQLYLESTRASGNGIKLYVGGTGFENGASVQRGEATLYIARPTDSDAYQTSLYMNGPSGEVLGMEMSITGGTYTTGYTTLAIPTVVGSYSGVQDMYIHGF